ncbi:hypothetical protein VTJ83DRAFT_1580 [Remersonia thermophila]|uniref:C2H2-type domain-containing protein n=1 Tax=Remersonia thermophila TaxID=72144 RepID=A0ABR4DGJ7_9PEZI
MPKKTVVWYCHNCSKGFWSRVIDDYCHDCGHARCDHCRKETIYI